MAKIGNEREPKLQLIFIFYFFRTKTRPAAIGPHPIYLINRTRGASSLVAGKQLSSNRSENLWQSFTSNCCRIRPLTALSFIGP